MGRPVPPALCTTCMLCIIVETRWFLNIASSSPPLWPLLTLRTCVFGTWSFVHSLLGSHATCCCSFLVPGLCSTSVQTLFSLPTLAYLLNARCIVHGSSFASLCTRQYYYLTGVQPYSNFLAYLGRQSSLPLASFVFFRLLTYCSSYVRLGIHRHRTLPTDLFTL
ncbi:hypothetical protein F5B22DRAFT_595946 [Xylaria bambusicola]|uniref:uncharacterized protein n=1 Tax=Xylaria bambusicola TaxID=326684 RepID=UPI0020087963|nr:uncharacterized protein F5B22DRAFT_595946 [Xylaria bambusicola]KAI0521712.1 hypothetical protein F5B22DRAFT_595946 [Xylaria bambusicola]